MSEGTSPFRSDSDAEFLCWQETLSGEFIPLFIITVATHPSYRSTVGEATLRKLHLRVPPIPTLHPGIDPCPWHSLGIELNHPGTAREAIEIAGLDYTVVKRRLETHGGLNRDAYAMVRTDTGDVLGIVTKQYEPIQNRDAFAFFDALVDEQKAVYETAGVLGSGERIWILAKLPGSITVHGNDIVNKYLLLINSHDGSIPVRVKLMPVRVACNNTLTSTLQGAVDRRNRATSNARQHQEQAVILFASTNSLYNRLSIIFNEMAAKRIAEMQLEQYVDALVPDSASPETSVPNKQIRRDLIELYNAGHGAHLARGTLWGAFNSAIEYADHRMWEDDLNRRLNSIWFGRGEQFKLQAFNLAEQMMRA